jgi:hypothetical protein
MGYQVGEDNFVFDKEFLEENDAPKELGPCLYFYNEGHYRNDVEPMLLGNLLSYLKQFPEDSKVFVTNKYQNIVHFQGSSYHEDGIWDENFTNISWTEFEKDMDDTFEVHGQGPILVVQSD